MTGIRIAMEQEITMHADGHQWRDTITLISKEEGGVGAKEDDKKKKTLELDLSKIKYHVNSTKKKKGVVKNVSPEDQYMMANI